MNERVDAARQQLTKMAEKYEEIAEQRRDQYGNGAYEDGVAGGYRGALQTLEWAFGAEQDWMYQRGAK